MSEPPVREIPAGFVDLGPASAIAEGTMKGFDLDGERVLVVHLDGRWHAVGGLCTHQVAYLEDGMLEPGRVLCPRHAAAFDLTTGEPLTAPADMPIPVYTIVVQGDRLLVSLTRPTAG